MAHLWNLEMQTAIAAVVEAAAICRSIQQEIPSAVQKEDRSPVTVADFASQAVICRALRRAFPDDPILAEEDSATLRQSEGEFAARVLAAIHQRGLSAEIDEVFDWIDEGNHQPKGGRFWTLDPIDGTKGFLRKEQYAISLALIVDGRVEVGALACPNLSCHTSATDGSGVLFTAIRGQGAWQRKIDAPELGDERIRVSRTSDPASARLCESVESGHSDHDLAKQIRDALGVSKTPLRLDSQAKYGVVARGDADIYLRLPTRKGYAEKIWDHAGGVLVVEEAGGRVTDLEGKPLDFSAGSTLNRNRGVLATNGLLHDQLLAALARFDQ